MSAFKARLTEARLKARNLISQGHVSNDISAVMEDLISVTVEFERQLTQAEGSSGDMRVLKSKVENLNHELRKRDVALEEFKKKVVDVLSSEIRKISGEIQKMVASVGDQESPVHDCAKSVAQSLRNIIELLAK